MKNYVQEGDVLTLTAPYACLLYTSDAADEL